MESLPLVSEIDVDDLPTRFHFSCFEFYLELTCVSPGISAQPEGKRRPFFRPKIRCPESHIKPSIVTGLANVIGEARHSAPCRVPVNHHCGFSPSLTRSIERAKWHRFRERRNRQRLNRQRLSYIACS